MDFYGLPLRKVISINLPPHFMLMYCAKLFPNDPFLANKMYKWNFYSHGYGIRMGVSHCCLLFLENNVILYVYEIFIKIIATCHANVYISFSQNKRFNFGM